MDISLPLQVMFKGTNSGYWKVSFGLGDWMLGASWKPGRMCEWRWGALSGPQRSMRKPCSAKVMLTEPRILDSRTISATDHFGQGLVLSVPASINLRGGSTILGMSVMDIYSPVLEFSRETELVGYLYLYLYICLTEIG